MRVTNKNREAVYSAIRQLQWLGKTSAEAGAALGMSVQMLNWHRRQIGLEPFELPASRNSRPDHWTAEEDAQLADAIDAGLNAPEAAEKIGRSIPSVTTRRLRLGLPYFKRRVSKHARAKPVWTSDRIRHLAEMRAKGVSFRGCAPKFQVTRNAIAGACDRYLSKERVSA